MEPTPDLMTERRDGIFHLRLHHPATRNSLTTATLGALAEALRSVDPDHDRAVLLAGKEPGSFCSGFRLGGNLRAEMASGVVDGLAANVYSLLSGCPVPTVAIVDGPAHGGGCELALRCDLRVATERASFAIPAARLGFPYSSASFRFLVSRYGQPAVALLMLAGTRLDATHAARLGLVTHLVDADQLDATVDELSASLRRAAPLVVRYMKTAIAAAENPDDPTLGDSAVAAARRTVERSADYNEALSAATERRSARFTGR